MNLTPSSRDSLDDGWRDPIAPRRRDGQRVSLGCGDTVLYRSAGQNAPAILVAPAGGGRWLARGARLMVHLDPASIVRRLPRNDLREEAA